MSSALKRVHSATGTVALVLALLALVASAAGVGYAAGQIGTNDIKNNAITAPKIKKNAVTEKKIKKNAVTSKRVKDGTLTAGDLVAQEAQKAATLGNGGEGDCVWQSGAALLPGLGAPTYRKDRFGTVHLTGIAIVSDGPGGDADCDPSVAGQASDGIAFTLPAGYIPAKTLLLTSLTSTGMIIVGAQGLTSGPIVLPPGAVYAPDGAVLDNVSFEPAGSSVVIPKMKAKGQDDGNLLKRLGLG
jgi:hypothetical protein